MKGTNGELEPTPSLRSRRVLITHRSQNLHLALQSASQVVKLVFDLGHGAGREGKEGEKGEGGGRGSWASLVHFCSISQFQR